MKIINFPFIQLVLPLASFFHILHKQNTLIIIIRLSLSGSVCAARHIKERIKKRLFSPLIILTLLLIHVIRNGIKWNDKLFASAYKQEKKSANFRSWRVAMTFFFVNRSFNIFYWIMKGNILSLKNLFFYGKNDFKEENVIMTKHFSFY